MLSSFVAPRSITVASGASGVATSRVAATASTVLSIRLGGSAVGTVTFGAGSSTGTVNLTSPLTLVSGSVVSVLNAATVDSTLEDIAITLRGLV